MSQQASNGTSTSSSIHSSGPSPSGSPPSSQAPPLGGPSAPRLLGGLGRDVWHGLRLLRRDRTLSAVAIVTLALGIGASATLFSALDYFLFQELPVERPERLVRVLRRDAATGGALRPSFSWPEFEDYRSATSSFAGLAAADGFRATLEREPDLETVTGELVSAGYFDVLGVDAALGRGFRPEEAGSGAEPVVVLAHRAWQRLGADPELVGATVELNDRAFTVVGVLPPGFHGDNIALAVDVFVPVAQRETFEAAEGWREDRGERFLLILGRLAPGVDRAAAGQELRALDASLARALDVEPADEIAVLPERAGLLNPESPESVALAGTAATGALALVALLVCANLAGLLLARGTTRRAELGVRLVLGAGRGRLARQLLVETLVLTLPGGALGLLVAFWGTDLLVALLPPTPVPLALDFTPDLRVAAFTFVTAGLAGLLAGGLPAFHLKDLDPAPLIRSGGGTAGREAGGRSRSLDTLVVVQVAVSTVLLVGAALLLRTLVWYQSVDPGFEPRGGLVARVDLGTGSYDEATGRAFYETLLERVRALPDVVSAGLAASVPLGSLASHTGVRRADAPMDSDEGRLVASYNVVSSGFFRALDLPLLRGRAPAGEPTGPAGVVVNETLAGRLWPAADAVGQRIFVEELGEEADVVGLAADAKYVALAESPQAHVYLPFARVYRPAMAVHVRTSGDPGTLVAELRRVVHGLDRGLLLPGISTLEEVVDTDRWLARTSAGLALTLAAYAVLLAALGLYGVLAYAVGSRSREIGIRRVLGATSGVIIRSVVGRGLTRTLAGLFLGIAVGWVAARVLAGVVPGPTPPLALTFGVVALIVLGTGTLAAMLPARRAAAVDPARDLRG